MNLLIISGERDASFAGKKGKDIAQAKALLEILREDMPAEIENAKSALAARAKSWTGKLRRACKEYNIEL